MSLETLETRQRNLTTYDFMYASDVKSRIEDELARKKLAKNQAIARGKTHAQVATEVGLTPRSFREYFEGKKPVPLGTYGTRYSLALEKYYFNPEYKRWYPRNN